LQKLKRSASGDTTISARVLTVGRIKVNKEWCINDLETKYTQLLLSPGSNYDALPGGIDAAFVETILGTTKEDVEKAIWKGDTASANSQLKQFDGLVKIINAASGTVQANALEPRCANSVTDNIQSDPKSRDSCL
jgi:hypothetical protein